MQYLTQHGAELPVAIMDILPNPVLVKDEDLKYVWVNTAFESLFNVKRADLIGERDKDFFKDRQVAQCNGGDLRVLETGAMDEATETVFTQEGEPRETITRKSRLTLADGTTYLVGVMHDVTEVVNANKELTEQQALLEEQAELLRELADTDPLTGCLNRRALYSRIQDKKQKPKAALLLMDIDFFKKINDEHSHEAGDEALKHFANVAYSCLRPHDVLARVGGEEFAVYLPDASDKNCYEIGERIREAVAKLPFMFAGKHIPMTVSIGGSCNVKEQFQLDNHMRIADECLYEAKQSGRNRLVMAA